MPALYKAAAQSCRESSTCRGETKSEKQKKNKNKKRGGGGRDKSIIYFTMDNLKNKLVYCLTQGKGGSAKS